MFLGVGIHVALVISMVESILLNESSHFQWHQGLSNFHEAYQTCSKLGKHWSLPKGSNYITERSDLMRERSTEYVWLAITKKNFNKWTWVNGETYSGVLPLSAGAKCAGVSIQGRRLRPMICGEKGNGFVCEMPDNIPCPLREHRQNCLTADNIVYHLGCFTESWFHARSYCVKHGGDLAILDTTKKQHAILDYIIAKKYVADCSWIFTGLRTEDWYVHPSQEVLFNPQWGLDQPRAKDSCAQTDSKGIWRSYPCDQLGAILCQNYDNTTNVANEKHISCNTKGVSRSSNVTWMVSCLVFVILFLSMTVAVLYIRRRKLQESLAKKLRIVPSDANIVIFSSGKIKQGTEVKMSISNINFNKRKKTSTEPITSSKIVTVINQAYRKFDKNSHLQIVNVHFKECKGYLPDGYIVDILQFLLQQSGVIQAVLLPRFDNDLSNTKDVLSMLWDLREKVILISQATNMPSLPADEVLAISERAVTSKSSSGNVDFVVEDGDKNITSNGFAYVVGLAAAIKVLYSKKIEGARTKFIRRLFLNMITRQQNLYNGFGILETTKIILPDKNKIEEAKKSINRDLNAPMFFPPTSSEQQNSMIKNSTTKSNTTKDFEKIKIGLLRPCAEPLDDSLSGWKIKIENRNKTFTNRLRYQDEELHTITNTMIHLRGKRIDVAKLKEIVEIKWFSVCDDGWRYSEDAFKEFMKDIIKCHVVYVTNIMYKYEPSPVIEGHIFEISQKCVALTQALNKQSRGAPCDIPADRVISIGQKTEAREQGTSTDISTVRDKMIDSQTEKDYEQSLGAVPLLDRNTGANQQDKLSTSMQSIGSTLDFLCGFNLEQKDDQAIAANFQGVAVAAMILIKAASLGLESQILERLSTTSVMHAVLRQMSSHPEYHTLEEGWGELQPQHWLDNDDAFKTLIKQCAHPFNDNKYWAGKNV